MNNHTGNMESSLQLPNGPVTTLLPAPTISFLQPLSNATLVETQRRLHEIILTNFSINMPESINLGKWVLDFIVDPQTGCAQISKDDVIALCNSGTILWYMPHSPKLLSLFVCIFNFFGADKKNHSKYWRMYLSFVTFDIKRAIRKTGYFTKCIKK